MNDFAELFSIWILCVMYAVLAPIILVWTLCYEAVSRIAGNVKGWCNQR